VSDLRPTRAQARANQVETIKLTSRRLMARHGAAGLSLREVAREMGLVSSAIYRYFATRDELLTALIVDAYNDLGAAAERAGARSRAKDSRQQLHAVATSIRHWAKANPYEYALLYGSPVPGYQAPQLTIEPATRVTQVLSNIISAAWRDARDVAAARSDVAVRLTMFERAALDSVMPDVPDLIRARALMVWTQIFGFISFEMFGHYVGSVRNATAYFTLVVDECATLVMPT
jgi:AcrR family transcriptional regulator